MNPSEAKDELSENIYPYGIITSKGSDERRHFPPPECQRRSLLRTLNHHSASVRPFACGSAAHFTFVKCECGIINAKAFMIRLRRGIYRACEFSSRCSETHMRNYTKILRIYGIISTVSLALQVFGRCPIMLTHEL